MLNYFGFLCQPSFPPLAAILWTPLMCCPSPLFDVNPAEQIEQGNGFSPVWILSWLSHAALDLIIFEQNLHLNFGSSCDLSCDLTEDKSPSRKPQCLQLYFSSLEWISILCFNRVEWVLKTSEHSEHGYFSWLWTDITWWFNAFLTANLDPHLSQ